MVDRQQTRLDELVEVEARGVGRHPDLAGRLLATDAVVTTGHEGVEAAPQRVGQRADRGERISHVITSA